MFEVGIRTHGLGNWDMKAKSSEERTENGGERVKESLWKQELLDSVGDTGQDCIIGWKGVKSKTCQEGFEGWGGGQLRLYPLFYFSTNAKEKWRGAEERQDQGLLGQGKHKRTGAVKSSEKQRDLKRERKSIVTLDIEEKDRRVRTPKSWFLEMTFVVRMSTWDQSTRKWAEILIWYTEQIKRKKAKVVKVKNSKVSRRESIQERERYFL